jgi:hypothetical protein
MSTPDMYNYFETPDRSISRKDNKLVLGGTAKINGLELTAEDVSLGIAGGGLFNYNDAATSVTPISVLADTDTVLTNDGLGPQTERDLAPVGIADLYDINTNSFLLSGLRVGDIFGIRLDCLVTTTQPNQTVNILMHLGSGAGSFTLPWMQETTYKVAAPHRISAYSKLYVGSDNVRESGGQFKITTDDPASVVVNGWFIELTRHVPTE